MASSEISTSSKILLVNKQLEKLYNIGKKESRIIIGLMSGTSLDGLDIALCKIHGAGKNTRVELLRFETISYEDTYKNEVREVYSKPLISSEKICLLNEWIGMYHAGLINACLKKWNLKNEDIDLIASHGQTIYHAPKSLHKHETFGNGTLQIGDGDHIACHTGIITLSDFRQKHIAAGGEGAPLAAYGDYLLFANNPKSLVLLNIGGIANLTFIPANKEFEHVKTTDIGPGNILMDIWIRKHFPGLNYDKDADIARSGMVNKQLLKILHQHPFIKIKFPKTTGPEIFNESFIREALGFCDDKDIPAEDVTATLNQFTADLITASIDYYISSMQDCEILISGGGIHNKLLMDKIKKHFTHLPVSTTLNKEISPDAKEAIIFALLANESVSGNRDTFGKGGAKMPATGMGKISFPY